MKRGFKRGGRRGFCIPDRSELGPPGYSRGLYGRFDQKERVSMKTYQATVTGVSPLLINRFKENDEHVEAVKKATKKDYGTPREQAEATAYRDEKDQRLWVPSTWISGAIRSVASDYKMPGTRKSVKSISGGAIVPVDEKCYFIEGYAVKDVEIDSRPVVIQRARIMRHRARLEKRSFSVCLEIDNEIIEPENVHRILSDAGRRCGIGDFRPNKGGPFGKFLLSAWSEI